MDKEKLKILGSDPKYISGVYNYCDRWCERCPFTNRCLNYEISEDHFADPESRDINNELFWQKLSETFQATLELVNEMMEEQGIDIDSDDIEEIKKEEEKIRETVDNHQLIISAKEYVNMVKRWYESTEDLFLEKEIDLNNKVELDLPKENPDKEAAAILDAVDVITWYLHFIQVKLMRAIHGELEDRFELPDEFPKDSDGSAKTALIAIDRSISAWGKMLNYFPDQEDELYNILIKLEQLRRNAEEKFPEARAFVRAGFDDMNQEL
jgi:hypothetical protein